ncbi:MAG TPA: hypothetical protein PKX78_00025 [Candidatus Woesebacteria bacterium]|nr:hypothetical protein [Candidatus Woesebacteria bacterium]
MTNQESQNNTGGFERPVSPDVIAESVAASLAGIHAAILHLTDVLGRSESQQLTPEQLWLNQIPVIISEIYKLIDRYEQSKVENRLNSSSINDEYEMCQELISIFDDLDYEIDRLFKKNNPNYLYSLDLLKLITKLRMLISSSIDEIDSLASDKATIMEDANVVVERMTDLFFERLEQIVTLLITITEKLKTSLQTDNPATTAS